MTHLHLSFTTPDLAATASFYRDLFDLEPDKQEEDYVRFTVSNPPLVLALREGPAAPLGYGIDHLGIRLQDSEAVTKARLRLAQLGRSGRQEEAVSCCYAVQDKVWFADPDGRPWEVYTVLGESNVLVDANSGCCEPTVKGPAATGCCG